MRVKWTLKLNHKVKFKLEYVMEVDDFELLELVNDYQERSDEPTFNTLDDIPEALMIEALDELFFRPVKDYSPGADCKKKIYEDNIKGKYNVQFVLEDNYKCVEMWREQGLVCLQPNEGKF